MRVIAIILCFSWSICPFISWCFCMFLHLLIDLYPLLAHFHSHLKSFPNFLPSSFVGFKSISERFLPNFTTSSAWDISAHLLLANIYLQALQTTFFVSMQANHWHWWYWHCTHPINYFSTDRVNPQPIFFQNVLLIVTHLFFSNFIKFGHFLFIYFLSTFWLLPNPFAYRYILISFTWSDFPGKHYVSSDHCKLQHIIAEFLALWLVVTCSESPFQVASVKKLESYQLVFCLFLGLAII